MQPIIYKIRLDAGKAGSQAYIQVKRGDTRSRQLSLYLYNGATPYEIAPGVLPVIQAIKPDGTVVFDDCEVSGNIIKRLLPAQLFAASGTVECELVLYGTNGETLYSPRFDIYVDDPLLEDDEITSTSEFTALANALAQANQYKLVWSNPYATAESGDEAKASIKLTDDGVFFNFVLEKGDPGEDGEDGADGIDGAPGKDGEPGKDGAPGKDGVDGVDGEDGFSPVITEHPGNNSTTYRLNIETATGTFATPNLKGKDADAADLKLTEINTTAFADAWGDVWPYTQVVDAPGVTAESQLTVGLNNALVPAADYAIVTAAQLRAVDSATDTVTMEALGTVPTIDIPIIVYDFGVPEPEEPELVVIDLPVQTGSLTYTGGVQSPTWLGYDTATMSIGGTSTATNAGTYYATFTPYDGYMWADGTQEEKSVLWSIGRATVASVPTQSGSLTYNGSAQSPAWDDYDTTKLTIGGTTSSTNAGSFNATFTPTANYQWYDGTTAAKNAPWSIAKAAGSLSIDKTSVTLNSTTTTANITVTRAGDGAISAISNNTGVATVSVTGNTVTVFSVDSTGGEAIVTISVAEGTNHTAPASKSVAVTAEFMPAVDTLANTSWSGIKMVADAGLMDDYGWNTGDTKLISFDHPVLGLSALSMEYVGKYYDDLADGAGKAPMSFIMTWAGSDETTMHSIQGPITDAWAGTEVFTEVLPELLAEVEAVIGEGIISPVIKYCTLNADDDGAQIVGVTTKLWQPSVFEMTSLDSYPAEKPTDMDSGYPRWGDYYEGADNGRVKLNGSTPRNWWTRTYSEYEFPGVGVRAQFYFFDTSGSLTSAEPVVLNALVFGFCVGNPNK